MAALGRQNVWKILITFALALVLAAIGIVAFRDSKATAASADQCALVRLTETGVDRKARAALSPKLAVLGDSYAQGMYLDDPATAFPYLLDPAALVNGSGGSGYSSGGPCKSQQLMNRAAQVLASKPAVLIVQAGINDRGRTDVGVAAKSLFDRIKSASPNTRVIVVGPFAPASVAGPELDAVAAAVQRAAQADGFTYLDPSDWEFDLLEDGLHPSAEGHKQIAAKLAALLD